MIGIKFCAWRIVFLAKCRHRFCVWRMKKAALDAAFGQVVLGGPMRRLWPADFRATKKRLPTQESYPPISNCPEPAAIRRGGADDSEPKCTDAYCCDNAGHAPHSGPKVTIRHSPGREAVYGVNATGERHDTNQNNHVSVTANYTVAFGWMRFM